MSTLGELLVARREANGLDLEAAVDEMNRRGGGQKVTTEIVAGWEAGEEAPARFHRAIARFLGVDQRTLHHALVAAPEALPMARQPEPVPVELERRPLRWGGDPVERVAGGVLLDDYARPTWHHDAACRGIDPDLFFPSRRESAARAVRVCASCPVVGPCRAEALADPALDYGVRGGLTEEQRKAMRC